MRISDIIRRKGDGVVTIRSDATVLELLEILEKHRIGAVVVSDDGLTVTGIVSIGDIVKGRIDELQTERDHLVGYIQQ